jgi:hypothetical protein
MLDSRHSTHCFHTTGQFYTAFDTNQLSASKNEQEGLQKGRSIWQHAGSGKIVDQDVVSQGPLTMQEVAAEPAQGILDSSHSCW